MQPHGEARIPLALADGCVKANPKNYITNHNTYLSEDEYWSILTEQKEKLDLAFA